MHSQMVCGEHSYHGSRNAGGTKCVIHLPLFPAVTSKAETKLAREGSRDPKGWVFISHTKYDGNKLHIVEEETCFE